jgi:hypothetical protein
MSWFKRKPTMVSKLKAALAHAEERAMVERDLAAYYQALADLNEHQATANKHKAMAEYQDQMVDRYRSDLEMIEQRKLSKSVTTELKEESCPDLVFTPTAQSESSRSSDALLTQFLRSPLRKA